MLKYQAVALALKAFDLSPGTRRLYKAIGNSLGGRSRPHSVGSNIRKAEWTLRKWQQYRGAATPSYTALEVGTGWVHFCGLFMRLFADLRLTLYDVVDNRRFPVFQQTFAQIQSILRDDPMYEMPDEPDAEIFEIIAQASSFEEVYRDLDARYVLSETGTLSELPSGGYDVLFSSDVLEHVDEQALEAAVNAYFRVLKPGGISLHQIGNDDHLTHYDRKASRKQYLAYSDRAWKLRFANGTQYINRVSFDRFRQLFRNAGFEELEARVHRDPGSIAKIRVAPGHADQSRESLEAVRIYLIHRKPLDA